MLRVLELGNYVVPAYCGMVLAEQGHEVVKWTNGRDPILGCHRARIVGVDQRGQIPREQAPARRRLDRSSLRYHCGQLSSCYPGSMGHRSARDRRRQQRGLGVDASRRGDRSFDLIAQARPWMDFCPWVPFWIGDTAGGLWLAFKALAMHHADRRGHFVLHQAGCLAKLVEGELTVDAHRPFGGPIPWESEPYHVENGTAVVQYKGETIREPIRDRAWRLANLKHRNGRLVV